MVMFCLACHVSLVAEYQEQTVNLSRTSLCSVLASNVNGTRAMDNRYYGILNAFDDGAGNTVNNIKYTDWLGSYSREWVEVRFVKPVRVSKVVVEDGPRFSAVMFLEGGTKHACGEAKALLALEEPIDRVRTVRLSFTDDGGKNSRNIRVREIKVLGNVPAGTEYVAQTPTVVVNEDTARLTAAEKFGLWRRSLTGDPKVECKEDEGAYRMTFRREQDGLALYQVVVDKRTSAVTVRPLSELVPKGGDARPDAPADAAEPRR